MAERVTILCDASTEGDHWGVGIKCLTDRGHEWSFGGFAHELYDLQKPTGGIDVAVAESLGIIEAVLLGEGVATGMFVEELVVVNDRMATLATLTNNRGRRVHRHFYLVLRHFERTLNFVAIHIRQLTFRSKRELNYGDKWRPDALARAARERMQRTPLIRNRDLDMIGFVQDSLHAI